MPVIMFFRVCMRVVPSSYYMLAYGAADYFATGRGGLKTTL